MDTTKNWKLEICLYVAVVLIVWNYPAASTDSTLSVRWSPTVYPDQALIAHAVEDFNDLLDADWKDKIPVILKKDRLNAEQSVQLKNCAELFGVERSLYRTKDPTDWHSAMTSLIRCKAMQIMARMKPSRTSFIIPDIPLLTPDLAKLRPDSKKDELKLVFSGLRERVIETKCFSEDVCRVTTKDDVYMLSRIGSGDYNGDGIEDLVLIISSSPARGTATSGFSLGFVITREASGKALTILDRFEKE